MVQYPVITDFTAGILTPKFSGRFDLPVYRKGVQTLTNWQPLTQGGITLRGGTTHLGGTKNNGRARILPFVVNENTAYLLEVGSEYIRFWKDDALIESAGIPVEAVTPYSSISEIFEIQVAQVHNRMFLVHRSHPPQELTWDGGDSFTFGAMSFTGNAGEVPFQSANNYPGAISVFAGRLALGSTINEPQKFWVSKPFEYNDFTFFDTITWTTEQLKDPSTWADSTTPEYETVTNEKTVIGSGHAFSAEIASDRNDKILWMATSTDLIIGTESGEWIIHRDTDALKQAARLNSRNGSALHQGTLMGNAIVYVQGSNARYRQFAYEGDNTPYKSPDLNYQADHLLTSGVIEFDYSNEPEPILFTVLGDGTMAGFLSNPMYGVNAWFMTEIAGADIESVAVCPGIGYDEVYVVVERNGSRYLELFTQTFGGFHVDGGKTVTKTGATASGFDHLEGLEVSIVHDDDVYTETVSGGSVTLPAIDDGEILYIGLPFTAECKTMRQSVSTPYGISQMKRTRISNAYFRVLDSHPFKIGFSTDTSDLEQARITGPYTGDLKIGFRGDWTSDAWITIVQDQPLPATILCASPEVDV